MQIGNHDLTFVRNGDLVEVHSTNSKTSAEEGTPIRFKLGGADRLAADFPGVNAEFFINNGDHGGPGSITNG